MAEEAINSPVELSSLTQKLYAIAVACLGGSSVIGAMLFLRELAVEHDRAKNFPHDLHLATFGIPQPGEILLDSDIQTPEAPRIENVSGPRGDRTGLTPIVPLNEEYRAYDQQDWENFQEKSPGVYFGLINRARALSPDGQDKDSIIVAKNNLWDFSPENLDGTAYVLYHYQENFEGPEMRAIINGVLPGFRAVNLMLKDNLRGEDFSGGEVPGLPTSVDGLLKNLVFAPPAKAHPAGGGETGALAVVITYPATSVFDESGRQELRQIVSKDASHELTHSLIQSESKYDIENWENNPDFHLSHLCIDTIRAVADHANGFPLEVSGDVLLMLQRLNEAGNPDPLKLVLEAAVHPQKAKDLRETYNQVRLPGDPSAQALVDDPNDIVAPFGVMDYFLQQIEPYLTQKQAEFRDRKL